MANDSRLHPLLLGMIWTFSPGRKALRLSIRRSHRRLFIRIFRGAAIWCAWARVGAPIPSAEAVKAFATDPKYAPHAAARQAGSESRFQLIDDTDVAGTIPYLPKG